jgi:diacylglycerol kinase family enzyme
MCRTTSRGAYLQYVAAALLGWRERNVEGIDLVSCSEITCRLPEAVRAAAGHDERVYLEADGELLGRLPVRMTMQADALSLVVPATRN